MTEILKKEIEEILSKPEDKKFLETFLDFSSEKFEKFAKINELKCIIEILSKLKDKKFLETFLGFTAEKFEAFSKIREIQYIIEILLNFEDKKFLETFLGFTAEKFEAFSKIREIQYIIEILLNFEDKKFLETFLGFTAEKFEKFAKINELKYIIKYLSIIEDKKFLETFLDFSAEKFDALSKNFYFYKILFLNDKKLYYKTLVEEIFAINDTEKICTFSENNNFYFFLGEVYTRVEINKRKNFVKFLKFSNYFHKTFSINYSKKYNFTKNFTSYVFNTSDLFFKENTLDLSFEKKFYAIHTILFNRFEKENEFNKEQNKRFDLNDFFKENNLYKNFLELKQEILSEYNFFIEKIKKINNLDVLTLKAFLNQEVKARERKPRVLNIEENELTYTDIETLKSILKESSDSLIQKIKKICLENEPNNTIENIFQEEPLKEEHKIYNDFFEKIKKIEPKFQNIDYVFFFLSELIEIEKIKKSSTNESGWFFKNISSQMQEEGLQKIKPILENSPLLISTMINIIKDSNLGGDEKQMFFVDLFNRAILSENNRFESLFDENIFQTLAFFTENNENNLFLNFIFLQNNNLFEEIKKDILSENLTEKLIKEIKNKISDAKKENTDYIKIEPPKTTNKMTDYCNGVNGLNRVN